MPAKICRPSGTCAMPRRKRSAGGSVSIGSPPRRMVPPSLRSRPETDFASVDLPAPLAPSSVTISPRASVKLTFCNTRLRPYPTETDLSSRSGMVLASQIGLDDQFVLLNLRWRSPGNDGAGIDDHDLIGDGHHQRHVVFDDQYGNAERSDRAQQIGKLLRLGVVQSCRRLVEAQKLWLRHQRTHDLEQFLRTHRQFGGVGISKRR